MGRDTLSGIAPGTHQRGLLVGQTGCGKTTLAKWLIRCFPYCLALDPKIMLGATAWKPEGHLPGFTLARSPEELEAFAPHARRLQYRPDPEWQDLEHYDRVYRWVFDRRNTFVYTDETNLVCRGYIPTDGMRACITSGRERGIGMLHATQRPANIPGILLSESEHFYMFRLEKLDDRKRMAEMMPEQVVHQPATGHGFYYQGPGRPLQFLRLQLHGG
jgi:hypothetical protein